ncbi:MAG: DUF4476 domain-containing protein, partial [Bacteroidota bacterium]
MAHPEFDDAMESIKSKSFSDSKMRIAKQVTKSNCLSTDQVTLIIRQFSFETDKLEFAKYAYDYTYDRGNYFKVNDAFTFESSIKELAQYLDGR